MSTERNGDLQQMNSICDQLSQARILREPVGKGSGYWVGAPTVFHDPRDHVTYLTYRIRRPRGVSPDRGGEARIARAQSRDVFEDVFSLLKDEIGTASIERCYIHHARDGVWRYFISHVDPSDGRWCVSVIKAKSIPELDARTLQPLFRARQLGVEGVKDPWVMEMNACYYMFLSVALPTPDTSEQSHATLDIYNTGECISASALATSDDLETWTWEGVVFQPSTCGWDAYCRRINSVIPFAGRFLAFYDGSASHHENYEEKTGLAVSNDLRVWHTLTPNGPLFTSPYSSGSLRYIDGQWRDGKLELFFEFAREDGSHDLRVVPIGSEEFSSFIVPLCPTAL